MNLPVSPEVMHNELETGIAILKKWQERVEVGIPGVSIPAQDPEALESFLREFVGELQIVSGKCDTLVEALTSQ